MQPNPADALRKADVRDALTYSGFALLLLGLLVLMLWMSGFASLKGIEFYVAATVIAGLVCMLRARSDWKRSRLNAHQRALVEEKKQAATRAVASKNSWAKRISEDS